MQMRSALANLIVLTSALGLVAAQPGTPVARVTLQVKYVVQDAVYLNGGRNVGLAPGMTLSVYRGGAEAAAVSRPIADLAVTSVASASAVCEVHAAEQEVRQGDTAVLSARDQEQIQMKQTSRNALRYPQVVSFSEGDPIDEELRAYVPRPSLPEVNRVKGRIGLEYGALSSLAGLSSQAGFIVRTDMTRIAGTFWKFSGYYRGRLTSRPGRDGETLNDLMSRTYQLGFSYNNPQSAWHAGFGRLYVPWATSLSTIDGGFVGRRLPHGLTVGLFGGSAPDPTAWRYAPDRRLAGSFLNLEVGDMDSVHYNGTAGLALNRLKYLPDRQFVFFENGVFYKRFLSLYQNLEVDRLVDSTGARRQTTPSRSFTTLRMQPASFISFDVSHNYFREVPTFDARLVGTGLVDKMLFQGLSAGVRLELPYRLAPYVSLGRSGRSDDRAPSWNRMFGLYMGTIWKTGIRADARYSRFDSSFGAGSYSSLSLSREINERVRVELQGGRQDFTSPLAPGNRANWLGLSLDWPLGHYFLGASMTVYRGNSQDYNQWLTNFGYRF